MQPRLGRYKPNFARCPVPGENCLQRVDRSISSQRPRPCFEPLCLLSELSPLLFSSLLSSLFQMPCFSGPEAVLAFAVGFEPAERGQRSHGHRGRGGGGAGAEKTGNSTLPPCPWVVSLLLGTSVFCSLFAFSLETSRETPKPCPSAASEEPPQREAPGRPGAMPPGAPGKGAPGRSEPFSSKDYSGIGRYRGCFRGLQLVGFGCSCRASVLLRAWVFTVLLLCEAAEHALHLESLAPSSCALPGPFLSVFCLHPGRSSSTCISE